MRIDPSFFRLPDLISLLQYYPFIPCPQFSSTALFPHNGSLLSHSHHLVPLHSLPPHPSLHPLSSGLVLRPHPEHHLAHPTTPPRPPLPPLIRPHHPKRLPLTFNHRPEPTLLRFRLQLPPARPRARDRHGNRHAHRLRHLPARLRRRRLPGSAGHRQGRQRLGSEHWRARRGAGRGAGCWVGGVGRRGLDVLSGRGEGWGYGRTGGGGPAGGCGGVWSWRREDGRYGRKRDDALQYLDRGSRTHRSAGIAVDYSWEFVDGAVDI